MKVIEEKESDVKLQKGQTLIQLKDRVEVTCTDSHPFAKKGTKKQVHPLIADKGIKDGFYEASKK
jgi:hypothetical protein